MKAEVSASIVVAAFVALPTDLAACSPVPGFSPHWSQDLNLLETYRLAAASGVIALVAVALSWWRGKLGIATVLPVALLVLHPAWLMTPTSDPCHNPPAFYARVSLTVASFAVAYLASRAVREWLRARGAAQRGA